MTTRTRIRWAVTTAIAVALAVAVPTAATAAPVTGTLLVFPGDSSDTAPMKVFTSGGCPQAATGYYTKVSGHGFPAGGVVVSTPTDAGMSHVGSFYAYFRETMRDYAKEAATTLHGRYDITVYCVDDLDHHYAEYTGSIAFATPAAYVALGTARPTGTTLPTPASPVPPDGLVPATPSAPPVRAAAGNGSNDNTTMVYAGLGIVALLLLVAVFKYGQRSALRAAEARPRPRTSVPSTTVRSRR
jgi:hypothetical protein